jgi:hypothetical protein
VSKRREKEREERVGGGKRVRCGEGGKRERSLSLWPSVERAVAEAEESGGQPEQQSPHQQRRTHLRGRQALVRVDDEDPLDEVLCRGGDDVPLLRVHGELPGPDLVEEDVLVLVGKGRVAAEEDVEDDAERPHVALGPVLGTRRDHLRRNVAGRPARRAHHLVGAGEDLGEAHVRKLDGGVVVLALEEDVLGLEVAVDDALGVRVGHR